MHSQALRQTSHPGPTVSSFCGIKTELWKTLSAGKGDCSLRAGHHTSPFTLMQDGVRFTQLFRGKIINLEQT